MKKILVLLVSVLLIGLSITSCEKDNEDVDFQKEIEYSTFENLNGRYLLNDSIFKYDSLNILISIELNYLVFDETNILKDVKITQPIGGTIESDIFNLEWKVVYGNFYKQDTLNELQYHVKPFNFQDSTFYYGLVEYIKI